MTEHEMNNELIERIDLEIAGTQSVIDCARAVLPDEKFAELSSTMDVLRDCKAALTQQQEAEPAGKVATYYAVSFGDYIQFDSNTGQLEIYETEKEAMLNCPMTLDVIAVDVRRHPANPAALPQVPDGYQLVPVEPTDKMISAGWSSQHPARIWELMLNASKGE